MWIEPKHNNWQDNEAKGVGATTKTMELLHFRLRCIHFTQGLKVLIAAKTRPDYMPIHLLIVVN